MRTRPAWLPKQRTEKLGLKHTHTHIDKHTHRKWGLILWSGCLCSLSGPFQRRELLEHFYFTLLINYLRNTHIVKSPSRIDKFRTLLLVFSLTPAPMTTSLPSFNTSSSLFHNKLNSLFTQKSNVLSFNIIFADLISTQQAPWYRFTSEFWHICCFF